VEEGIRERSARRAPGMRHRRITRERVLDAAETLFLQKGFRAISVHEIAAAAGYTTGAIYSSFSGKDELFLAVADRRIARQHEIWRSALQSVSESADAALALGDALTRAMPEPAWTAVYYEFLSDAARNQQLRHRLAEVQRAGNSLFAEGLSGVTSSSLLPLDRLAPIIAALMRGCALMSFVDPDADDVALFSDGVAVLLGGTPAERSSSDRETPGGTPVTGSEPPSSEVVHTSRV
jgi:AcrR family transcriptional regulator